MLYCKSSDKCDSIIDISDAIVGFVCVIKTIGSITKLSLLIFIVYSYKNV